MLVICSTCEARLQLDENKLPSHAVKVRCPKCQGSIEVKPTASDADANTTALPADMTPPGHSASPFQPPVVAAQFKPADADSVVAASASGSDASSELAKLLAAALRRADVPAANPYAEKKPSWYRRKALVCANEENREIIAKGLLARGYEVYVAGNTPEALGRMREDHIEILVLESNFDPVEQGFAFVTREVKLMRPSERRRLFMIYLTAGSRTMDLHAAFLHNVNLVVNPADVERLPDALEVSLRHYNELYRDYNRALDLPAI